MTAERLRTLLIVALVGAWLFDRPIEMWLAPRFPVKVFVIEEDHTSITGQLNQAERLLELHINEGVRDIILEGYVGTPAPIAQLFVWLPGQVPSLMLDYVFDKHTLAGYMPTLAPTSPHRRMSIALPDLVMGEMTAAEFVGAVAPVRLHPGETSETYERRVGSQNVLCAALSRDIVEYARTRAQEAGADLAPLNRAYERALSAGSATTAQGQRRLTGPGQEVLIREFVQVIAARNPDWRRAEAAWREVCAPAAAGSVVSIERMLEHYRGLQTMGGLRYGGAIASSDWRSDIGFLEARSAASAVLAERAAHIARRLGRNVAVVIGAAHTEKVVRLLGDEPGITPVTVPMQNAFGQLDNIRLDEQEWYRRTDRKRTVAQDGEVVHRMGRLRRAPPVVQQDWFQARHELASVAERLVDAIALYQSGGSDISAAVGTKGRYVAVDPASIEQAGNQTGSELSGYLVRASVRLAGAEQSLWLMARQSDYLLPAITDEPRLTMALVHQIFDWLRNLTPNARFAQFAEWSDPRGAPSGRPSLITRLSLRAHAIIAHSRDAARAARANWR